MPHIVVKVAPGKSESQKAKLAEAIAARVTEIFKSEADAISVAIEEIPPAQWKAAVFDPDIQAKPDTLYKKPGYQM